MLTPAPDPWSPDMRALIAALLALAASASSATTPACWPSQIGGKGTRAVVSATANDGMAVMWACPSIYTRASLVWFAGPWSAFSPDWQAIGAALAAGTDAERSAAWTQHVQTWPKDNEGYTITPTYGIAAIINAAWDALQPHIPPPPVWKVAPNATYATRPAYAVSSGARATVSTARATVGAPCYCGVRFVEGSITYCAVTTSGAWVSVCRKE